MKRHFSSATALAIMAVTAVPLAGQNALRGERGPRGGAPGGWGLERQVERALDLREDLGLTDAQVRDLEALRSDLESTLVPVREQMEELRSRARDRSGDQEEVRERMMVVRDEMRALVARTDTLTAPLQSRFEQAVPPLQRRELRPDTRPGRVGVGRRGAAAGRIRAGLPGFRNGGAVFGSRGRRAFAPDRRGFRVQPLPGRGWGRRGPG